MSDKVNSEVKLGRPSLGITKKVSITLKANEWAMLDAIKKEGAYKSRSELLRKIIRNTVYCGLQEWFDPDE